ncbi:MAG: TonB-dependent receptor domain-containing protein [Prevotella sp.]
MRLFLSLIFSWFVYIYGWSVTQTYTVKGRVLDNRTMSPISYASVKVVDLGYSAITDENGLFKINNIRGGKIEISISVLGYVTRTINFNLDNDTDLKNIRLKEDNLSLPEVQVTSKSNINAGTTSYILDRTTLDHSQILNLSDISALLPGGQTVNSTLINDNRLSLRSGMSERGNAAFGTAIEVDGVRLDNNASMDETLSTSTRNISSSNIESVEIVSGIPSVEYGDISNGVVKINTKKGYSPWIVDASVNPHTKQIALNKGFALSDGGGILNVSLEHARSYSEISSPYTSYSRNVLSSTYNKEFRTGLSTIDLQAGITANIGGYSSESDPDAFKNTYLKVRDNQVRGNIDLTWQHSSDRYGVINVNLQTALSFSDKLTENNYNTNSSSSQAALHTMVSGYDIAQDYISGMGVGNIILGPTGYWYVKEYNDQKPLSLRVKIKSAWTKRISDTRYSEKINRLIIGSEFNMTRNNGKGLYYEDIQLAPTWRPYDYSSLPAMKTFSIFVEDKITLNRLKITAGLRDDITLVGGSGYGTISCLSPRANINYDIIKGRHKSLSLHIGYGKSVKLPSFQVLYPADSYSDKLVFTPGSTVDNKAYYAYYTHVSKALYNENLKWQYSNQVDFGVNGEYKGINLNISAFWSKTYNPYQMINEYTPFSYHYTSQSALEGCPIPSLERIYSIDKQTGVVTVSSNVDGTMIELPYTTHNTYISNKRFINGSPVTRYGIEWTADVPIIKSRHYFGLSLRIDGKYYHYKGIDKTLITGSPNGVGDYESTSAKQPLIGYYIGSNITSTSSAGTPSISNGTLRKGCNINTTITARMPKLRLIMTMRLEATLLNYKRNLSEGRSTVLLEAAGDVFGKPYSGERNSYVAVYPEYYSTWQNPDVKIPYAEALEYAKDNDQTLYQQLCDLIVRSNTSYYFNPQDISAYYSANFSITKEIGRKISMSFYANNFINNMSSVKDSQTGLETSLFSSSYIPKFYYGLSVRLKID